MLKQQSTTLAVIVYLVDIGTAILAFFAAWWLRSSVLPALLPGFFPLGLYPLSRYLQVLPWVILIWTVAFMATRSYRSQRTVPLAHQVIVAGKIAFGSALVLLAVAFVSRFDFVSRPWISMFAVLDFVLLAAGRLGVRLAARGVRRRGYNYRTVLIVGAGERAMEIADGIHRHSGWGLRLVGFVGDPGEFDSDRGDAPLLGDIGDLSRLLTDGELSIDEVLFVVARRRLSELDEAFLLCEELGVRARIVLDFLPMTLARVELEEFDGIPLLTFTRVPTDSFALLGKRVADVVLSAILVAAALPLLVLVALAIRMTSAGPVLFRQVRSGLNGRTFTLYKFRTMIEDAHLRQEELEHLNEMSGPVFKVTDDPRVTGVGRWLRRWSLDEIPQLLNVLRGDMSLVGPRPPLPAEVERYQRWQRRRLSMKPGITCLWQVSGRSDIDFDRWMELDLEYIDNWTPLLDWKILARTVPAVLLGRGAR